MSYLSPGDPELEVEAARASQREIEAKAEQYAQLHRGDDDPARRAVAVRRALTRARAALSRRR